MGLREALQESLEGLAARELPPVEVAVIDSGIDATHPDLAGHVVRAFAVEMVDDDPQLVECALGQNLDQYGHGTAVASVLSQVAPNARIIDIRVLNVGNVGAGKALLRGFAHAVEARYRVVNMSLAATAKFASALEQLAEKAYVQNQLVVAARRNMPLADNGFPAEFSSSISVDIGSFPSLRRIRFRQDHVVEFEGHGENVKAAAAGGGYTLLSGTSFATPAVSGLCALLVGAHPELRPFEVKSLLRAFSD